MKQIHALLKKPAVISVIIAVSVLLCKESGAYTVTNLSALYSKGQVFLTWTNPNSSNLQYNIYRSTSKFTLPSQLTTDKLMGFVRDNSSKNIHLSIEENQDIYYKITDNGQPLLPNQGVYAVTCTANQAYYYAVTVTNLVTSIEGKQITSGKNSLSTPINEILEKPQPVYQDSATAGGEVKYRYVQFGNNQETPLSPAFNSTGSYGFNFYLSKRGSATSYPLVVLYEGEGAVAGGGVGLDATFTDCFILGVYDWLPIPTINGDIGDNAHYCCYHENFNIYSNTGPVPASGIVKTYPQRRYIEAIHWTENNFPIDKGRIYLKGTSATGYGALLTAAIIPEEIAAVYAVVEQFGIATHNQPIKEQMWGLGSSHLNTDILNWNTQEPLIFTNLTNIKKMMDINEPLDIPLLFDVHGKHDQSIGWNAGTIEWFDTLESNHVGGVFYWDQRAHNGSGKNFLSEETTPDFFRYTTNKSYPAFTNCSVNQNPGTGGQNNGDPYGAFNGYLDWDDEILDNTCNYTINVMMKNFYVGGVLDPEQYNTCKTSITFRRLQNFQPNNGATIKWKNYDASNTKIQNGTLTYNGGLITINDVTVNKSGNKIQLVISNCLRTDDVVESNSDGIYFSRSPNGYTAHLDVNADEDISLKLYDLTGRIVQIKKVSVTRGTNIFEITGGGSGMYLVELKGNSFSLREKLLF